MLPTLWRHRALVLELAKREFSGRYQGSFGGIVWSFAQPLFLLSVYTLAFGVIFQAKWGFGGGTANYALMLFAGLIVFNAFAECLTRAPTLVTSNPNFVKRVVFPLEVLPWVMAITAVFHALIGVAVWVLGYVVLFGMPQVTVLLAPAILACFFPLLLAIGWSLAAIGVVIRDAAPFMALVSHALLFLTPIFYSIDAVPPVLQGVLLLNPLTFVVEQMRLVLFFGELPAVKGVALYFVLSCAIAWLALLLFRWLRPRFAEMV